MKQLEAEAAAGSGGSMEGGEKSAVEPKDRYNLAYSIHFLLGVADLLPWNAYITAVDYFSSLYPEEHVDKTFSVAYMGSSLLMLVALISTTRWRERPSVRWRMNAGLLLFVASLSVVPFVDLAWASKKHQHNPDGSRPRGDYIAMVSAVVICGLADGLFGGSLVGSTAELPKRYMQAIFVGTASSGIIVSILRIVTKASLPANPKGLRTSAHIYFIVSIIILLGCVVCYNILDKLPVVQYHRNRSRSLSSEAHLRCSKSPKDHPATSCSASLHVSIITEPTSQPKLWDVWKRIQWPACGVAVIYVVTLSIFPGFITEDVRSELLKDWYPILLIALYNLLDFVGKSLTAAYIPEGTKWAIWACFGRLVFYPLFAACLHGPRFFRTEIPVIFLTCALGLTNGYLTSVLVILAPKSVPSRESETAGTVMLLFLGIGLAAGSVIGWFWVI